MEYLEERSLLSLFPVTNLNDSGGGSLPQAIIDSNSNTTNETNEIDFSPGLSGTINLTTGELLIAKHDLKIVGPGQGTLSVSGNGNYRVFEIASGVTSSLSGLTITDGRADKGGGIYNAGTLILHGCTVASNETTSSWGGDGAGICNLGTVTVNSSTISGNHTSFWAAGGGISNASGTVTVNNSTITGNSATYGGGGISNGSGTVTINTSNISDNKGYMIAGGIYNDSGTMMISGSTISGNEAWGGRYGQYGGGIYNRGMLTIDTSNISNNSTGDMGVGGGGIYNLGTFTIKNSNISNNSTKSNFGSTGYGGGIYNQGTGTIDCSTISGNSAVYGAGIYSSGKVYFDEDGQITHIDFATMTISRSTISGNQGYGGTWSRGGGIDNEVAGTLTIEASTISGNSAISGTGGGISNGGTLIIGASTISGNSGNTGGGIYNGGTVTINTSTISGNTVYGWLDDYGSLVGGTGGGISNGGTMIVAESTIGGNTAEFWGGGTGGGISNDGTMTLVLSIVAGNFGGNGAGRFNSLGYNLIDDTEGSSGWLGTDILHVDPMLGPLQYNGGPTMTMAPLTDSPAIDAGCNDLALDPGTGQPVTTDQRGWAFPRIANGTVDIGAFEVQGSIIWAYAVAAGWGAQSTSIQTAGDGLRMLPEGRQTDFPWLGIQRVQISLTQDAAVTAGDITVLGERDINYEPVTVSGSGTNYMITLAQPINAADRVTLTICNPFIVGFTRRLDVLPGDVNDDGVVSASDVVLIRNAIQKIGDPLMIGWCDLDGNGAVDMTDFSLARKRRGRTCTEPLPDASVLGRRNCCR